jgi:competence protein ComEC
MQYRHLFPMVRILLPFMAGIIVSVAIAASSGIPLFILITLLMLTLIAAFISFKKLRFVKGWLFGLFASLFLFVSGYNLVILHKEILSPGHFSKVQSKGTFVAIVDEPLQEKDHSFKTILRIRGIKKGKTLIKADGLVLTYFAKDSVKKPPVEGTEITFSGDVQPISPPQNPGAFDYRKYMANNNVYHQVYLNNFSWKLLELPQGFNILRTAHQVSRKFVSILNENGLKGREFAVASALIMGQSDMLDNETLQAYSGTGVMHILSVSGLHVGVIFIIISFLLSFMKGKGSQLYFKTFVILLTIWAYALLTGMSPSVLRSAVMFTFISIGNATNRYVHIINSLAVSAIALLLINPLMINNIGFQLSYIAIVGIVFINKPIADLWDPKNRIIEYIWGLIAVSIAAQVATAPLAMLYFHQFPAYFIPANLVAIPLSFLAIYAGVAVLATSIILVISNILGIITNYLLFALNYSVGYIEKLPYSVLHITSIFTKETILIYLIIISLILFFTLKRKEFFYVTLCLILVLSTCFSLTEINRERQQKMIFYASGKQSAIGFINGKQQTILADSILIKDKIATKFQFAGAKSLFGIQAETAFALDTVAEYDQKLPKTLKPLCSFGNYFLFHDKRIAIIDSLPKSSGAISKLYVDYLWIRHNPKIRITDLTKLYDLGMIIIDGSNSFYRTEKWMAEFTKAGLKAYSLKNSGAYIVEL